MASASDVPGKYDVVIGSTGYRFLDAIEASLPFRTHKATYSYSPTFVERQNVQGAYGDNSQDFWLTASQKDWSLGEQQRYARVNDEDSARRYWLGTNIDSTTTPGQVSIRSAIATTTMGGSVGACCTYPYSGSVNAIALTSSSNLYTIDDQGSSADKGAHGLGAQPSQWGLCTDGTNVFLTTTSAGTVGVRKYNGTTFSTFSASAADSLAFLNNTLYGLRYSSGDLVRYDSTGTLTSLFTWKDAAGTAIALASNSKVVPFGGKLAILRILLSGQGELWIYDGTAPSLVARFSPSFRAYDLAEAQGILFASGGVPRAGASASHLLAAAIYYYANGTIGKLWQSDTTGGSAPALLAWRSGLLFNDATRTALLYYDAGTGAVQTVSASASGAAPLAAAGTSAQAVITDGTTSAYVFADSGTRASAATVTSSLFDFDSSLDKLFRGIKVDFDSATDGNGGTVDIAYRVGDVDGSYTTLQTGATAGTEYTLANISGRSISVKVTLNKGTSTSGPVLKRVYVRAAPLQQVFKRREYVLDLAGDNTKNPDGVITLRDATPSPLTGRAMANALITAATSTSALSITDRFSTYTGIIEPDGFELYEQRPNEFVAKVTVREI